jgi:hypothetical protein
MGEPVYRFSRHRALPPRILASPRVYALLSEPRRETGLREAILKCFELSRSPGTKLHGGYSGLGDFQVQTVWSPVPEEPDLFVILGPGDAVPFWRVLLDYKVNRDEALLDELIPVALV